MILNSVFQQRWNDVFLIEAATGRSWTYGQFFKAAAQIADSLKSSGLKPGDRIGAVVPNSIESLALYFACLLSGLVIAPIDPLKGRSELTEILRALSPEALFGVEDAIDGVELNQPHLKLDARILQGALNANEGTTPAPCAVDFQANQLYLITFTSGSTGAPKGVMHSAANLLLSAEAFARRFEFGPQNVFYHNLPMSYMAGILNQFYLPLTAGSRIVVGPRFNMQAALDFWRYPIQYGVDTFWLIPAISALLLKVDRGAQGIEYAQSKRITGCIGTAPLNLELKRKFEAKYKITLHESYGLSETLFVSTNSFSTPYKQNAVGRILDGAQLSNGDDGEIFISVPWMFLGYLNQSPPASHAFPSGDLGRVDEDGVLAITGRKKDLIIRGGVNVSPRRIEDFITELKVFDEIQVLGVSDVDLGEKTVCCFSAGSDVKPDVLKEVGRKVTEQLGRDFQVDSFFQVPSLPRNLNGKVDKQALSQLYLTR